ncbi:MAG: hypothetical protein KKD59_02130, partial [Acidobacteria bacterium]|nr:hypothetical protein [Acidobacteriota bacterium]
MESAVECSQYVQIFRGIKISAFESLFSQGLAFGGQKNIALFLVRAAAQKLYPGSLIVFPASQDKNIRNFFIESMAYLFNM